MKLSLRSRTCSRRDEILVVALDGYRSQACGSFNQANFIEERTAGNATVHFKRSKLFLIPTDYRCRTKFAQPENSGALDDCRLNRGVVISQARERNHVSDLGIQGIADFAEYLR